MVEFFRPQATPVDPSVLVEGAKVGAAGILAAGQAIGEGVKTSLERAREDKASAAIQDVLKQLSDKEKMAPEREYIPFEDSPAANWMAQAERAGADVAQLLVDQGVAADVYQAKGIITQLKQPRKISVATPELRSTVASLPVLAKRAGLEMSDITPLIDEAGAGVAFTSQQELDMKNAAVLDLLGQSGAMTQREQAKFASREAAAARADQRAARMEELTLQFGEARLAQEAEFGHALRMQEGQFAYSREAMTSEQKHAFDMASKALENQLQLMREGKLQEAQLAMTKMTHEQRNAMQLLMKQAELNASLTELRSGLDRDIQLAIDRGRQADAMALMQERAKIDERLLTIEGEQRQEAIRAGGAQERETLEFKADLDATLGGAQFADKTSAKAYETYVDRVDEIAMDPENAPVFKGVPLSSQALGFVDPQGAMEEVLQAHNFPAAIPLKNVTLFIDRDGRWNYDIKGIGGLNSSQIQDAQKAIEQVFGAMGEGFVERMLVVSQVLGARNLTATQMSDISRVMESQYAVPAWSFAKSVLKQRAKSQGMRTDKVTGGQTTTGASEIDDILNRRLK